jgi:dipeptidyl aminopeptidase/acylaminoacyl peptidase
VAVAGEPYPLEYFALREVVSNVEVSPGGKQVSMLKILSRNGDPVLYIHDTAALDKDPIVVNADPMEIRRAYWVNDSEMVLLLRQKIRDRVEGQNQGVYSGKITRLNVDKLKFEDFDLADPAVESLVRNDPNAIIVSTQPGLDDDLGLTETFRPRAYYKLNLKKGTEQLIIRGKIDLSQVVFDADGDPYLGRGFDLGKKSYVWYYRPKGGKGWDEIYRQHEDSFETFEVLGKDEAVPGNLIVEAHNGNNFEGLWSFNTKTKTFDELIYRRSDVDVYGVRRHSNRWSNPDAIAAVSYFKDKFHYEYFDEIEGATYAQLESLVPHAWYTAIESRSRDGNTFTVFNQGPRDPGTYYLFKDGVFTTLGSQQPLLDSEELADLEYITYKARDGRKIPAFLTVPNGEGPFPTVVLPHGGPFVHEIVVYDEWAQMLANNGYLVMQPQYRMSLGYGQEHFQSAFINGSEAGRKMQDDKDDGAKYLIEQGLADPDRIAMFGWSYGGYAALIAASRAPQLYQCVIAGASIADPVRQRNEYRNDRGATKILNDYRLGAVSPIEEIDKVNVPMLLVHGDVDQRVQLYQAEMYVDKLEKLGKPHKFVVLEGADHFYDTLFFEHQIQMYESMIDFLQNDCGMKSNLQVRVKD